jgi:hypothetical protein
MGTAEAERVFHDGFANVAARNFDRILYRKCRFACARCRRKIADAFLDSYYSYENRPRG